MTLSGQVYWYQFHQDSTLFPSVTMFQGPTPLFHNTSHHQTLQASRNGTYRDLEHCIGLLGESVFLQHVVALVIL